MKRYRWDAIIDRVDKKNPIVIAEVGVWKGALSRKLLEALPNMTLIQVDRWTAYSEEENIAEGNTKMSRLGQDKFDFAKAENDRNTYLYKNRTQILKGDSTLAGRFVEDNSLDLVFIDAGHSYRKCKADILAWLPKVKTGGWIGGHDYLRDGVYRAVTEIFSGQNSIFYDCIKREIETDSNKTWFVRV